MDHLRYFKPFFKLLLSDASIKVQPKPWECGLVRMCSDAFRLVWMSSNVFGGFQRFPFQYVCVNNLVFVTCIFEGFLRSWRQRNLEINFCVKFCSKSTNPEVTTIKRGTTNVVCTVQRGLLIDNSTVAKSPYLQGW